MASSCSRGVLGLDIMKNFYTERVVKHWRMVDVVLRDMGLVVGEVDVWL